MKKSDEVSDPSSCLSQAMPDETVFVLLGRDAAAPIAIRAWVRERILSGKNLPGDAQIVEALATAMEMDKARPNVRFSMQATKNGA